MSVSHLLYHLVLCVCCSAKKNGVFLQENAELRQQLQSSEREKQTVREQWMRKEAELTRAEETIRREQQQIQEIGQQVSL